MTTRERIQTLADNGDYLNLIAARLDISPEEVARTLSDPTYDPPEISAGSTQYAQVWSSGGGSLGFFGAAVVPLVQIEREEDSLKDPNASVTHMVKVGAGGTVLEPEILGPPEDPAWKVFATLSMVNLEDPTVSATGVFELPLRQKLWTYPTPADLTQREGWAADLEVVGEENEEFGVPFEFTAVKSTAGGLFYVEVLWQFSLAE